MDINEIKYTSPSGKEFSFAFENLSKETDLKTATFTFPEKDGAYIQSLGRGGRRFPMTCIFTGEDCNIKADNFEAALEERGVGSLQHPVYGTRSVVPTGSIKRNDGLVTEYNTSTVEITFSETLSKEQVLKSSVELSGEVSEAMEKFADSSIAEFSAIVTLVDASETMTMAEVMGKTAELVTDQMDKFVKDGSSNWLDDMSKAVNDKYTAIRRAVKEATKYTNNIRQFSSTILAAMRLPAAVICAPMEVISTYSNLVTETINMFKKDPIGVNKIKNQFANTKFAIMGAVASLCEVLSFGCANSGSSDGGSSGSKGNSGGFKSREDAMNTVTEIIKLYDTVKDFCDTKIEKNVYVETEESYVAFQDVVTKTVAQIIESSFSLRNRRIIVLDRDRALIELVGELYQDIDSNLDEFIMDNHLNWETLKILPMGSEVSYYV